MTGVREHTFEDIPIIEKLVDKIYFTDGWLNSHYARWGTKITHESTMKNHFRFLMDDNSKSFLGERDGKIICSITGCLGTYIDIGQEKPVLMVSIVAWIEDKDESPGEFTCDILQRLMAWGKERGAKMIQCSFNPSWPGSKALPWVLKEIYGFEPDHVFYIKEI
jgi:hypothetical protein